METTAYKFNSKHLGEAFMQELIEMGYKYNGFGEFDSGCHTYILDEHPIYVMGQVKDMNNYDVSFQLETQWNEALRHAKHRLNHKFKVGDWIRLGEGSTIARVASVDEIGYSLEYPSGLHDFISFEYQCATKVTPEEIKTALIKEAQRRGFPCKEWNFPGYKRNFSNPQILHNHKWKYFEKTDILSNNGGTVYKQGKWAKPIESVKFFDWDIRRAGRYVTIAPDCPDKLTIFDKDLGMLETYLSIFTNRKTGVTVEELLSEIKKINK